MGFQLELTEFAACQLKLNVHTKVADRDDARFFVDRLPQQTNPTAFFASRIYSRRLQHRVLHEQRRDVFPVQG